MGMVSRPRKRKLVCHADNINQAKHRQHANMSCNRHYPFIALYIGVAQGGDLGA